MGRKTKTPKHKPGEPITGAGATSLPGPPIDAAHYHRLGNALFREGKLDEAAVNYSQALKLAPNSPETINSLGVLLYTAGRIEQSVVFYQKAISLKPDYADAYNNLGIALKDLERLDEALESFDRALQQDPRLAAAYSNTGEVLILQGEIQRAIASLRKAIELEPSLLEAYQNLGNALNRQGLLTEAIETYKQAIALAPTSADVYNNLAETYKEQGKLEEAAHAFEQALSINPHLSVAYSNLLCFYGFTRYISPEAEKDIAQGWEKGILTEDERTEARRRASSTSGAFPVSPRTGRPLRLGIVSADLGSHAVSYFLEPILEELDRSRFHLTLFPTLKRSGSLAERLRSLADNYISLSELSDVQAADRIRSEQIDVLVNTTGHTLGGRLGIFAHRAAPVQCSYIGYCGTTGLTEMDWIFGERSLAAHFSERVWEVPPLGVCYRGETSLPESSWAPDPDGTIWLGSFNRYGKIREETLALWAKVLLVLPEAKLLLEDSRYCEEETHQRILSNLAAQGISEMRVTFIPYVPGHERHMDLYNRLDIALDTLPFNGGTTAFDALWMGVPLVAMEGDWTGGRMGSLLLKAFERPEWVAHTEDEYVSIVCTLARDIERRKSERRSQRARMERSPLCDAKLMTRGLEGAFEAMFDNWISGP